jgi:hypothetical protein
MNRFHDKMIAKQMLQAQQHGYTFGHFLRINAKRYMFLLPIDCLFICYWAYFHIWIGFYIAIGLVVGSHCEDLSWFRGNRKRWPVLAKTLDWQKVESLSKEEPSA